MSAVRQRAGALGRLLGADVGRVARTPSKPTGVPWSEGPRDAAADAPGKFGAHGSRTVSSLTGSPELPPPGVRALAAGNGAVVLHRSRAETAAASDLALDVLAALACQSAFASCWRMVVRQTDLMLRWLCDTLRHLFGARRAEELPSIRRSAGRACVADPATHVCGSEVALHVVEESSLSGTKYSAVPRPKAFRKNGAHVYNFATTSELERALFNCMATILIDDAASKPTSEIWTPLRLTSPHSGRRHLLVLSAHGVDRTGTALRLQDSNLSAHLIPMGLLQVRPANLVVFLSACWGAFPAYVDYVRIGGYHPPTVLGAIVAVHPRHANELQKRIVQSLCQHGHDEARLALLVRDANRALRDRYPVGPFRIVLRNGRRYPKRAGLAATELRTRKFLIVAVQPNAVVLLGGDGKYWLASPSVFPSANFGRVVYLRARVNWSDEGRRLGALCEIRELRPLDRIPGMFASYRPPLPHCALSAPIRTSPRELALGAIDICRRCNWAQLQNKRQVKNGVHSHSWRVFCHYPKYCPVYDGHKVA